MYIYKYTMRMNAVIHHVEPQLIEPCDLMIISGTVIEL